MAWVFGQLGHGNCHIRGPKNGQKTGKIDEFYSDPAIRVDELSLNASFPTRNTPFSDLCPRFWGNLVPELATIGAWMIGVGGVGWGGEGAKVMQGLHDSIQNLVVVQTFSLLRLSRGQPPPRARSGGRVPRAPRPGTHKMVTFDPK